jgi:hypothetical protein
VDDGHIGPNGRRRNKGCLERSHFFRKGLVPEHLE